MNGSGVIDVMQSGSYQVQNFSIENPTTNLHEAAKLYDVGGATSSGVRVSERTALGISAVWQAITMISGDVAKLPLYLYRYEGDPFAEDTPRHRVKGHRAARLLRKKPNPHMNTYKFWQRVMAFRLLYNNAYVWIRRDRMGRPFQLWPLLPSHTWARHDGDGRLWYHTTTPFLHDNAARLLTLAPWEVLHLEGICIDGLCGEQYVHHAREAFGLALARQRYAANFFKNGGRFGGFLEIPAAMSDKARENVEAGFRKVYDSIDAAFKTFVGRDNVKFHPGQHSPEQAQLVEGERSSVRDVARRFSLHPSKLGEDQATSYNSKAEDNRDYHDSTLSNHLTQIAEECNDKLLTKNESDSDLFFFEHNTDKLLQLDGLKRAQRWKILRSIEAVSPNEVRHGENMPPRTDPGGDDYSNPNTKSKDSGGGDGEQSQGEGRGDAEPKNQVAEKHRELLRSIVGAKLKPAMQKISRHQKKDGFEAWRDAELPSLLLAVAEPANLVIDAFAATSGIESERSKAKFFASLSAFVNQAIHTPKSAGEIDIAVGKIANELIGESHV